MIEASENIDLVTARRAADFADAQQSGAAQTVSVPSAQKVTDTVSHTGSVPAATMSVPIERGTDPARSGTGTDTSWRVWVAGVLVVVLFVAWVWQRKAGRAE